MDVKQSQNQIELVIEASFATNQTPQDVLFVKKKIYSSSSSILTKIHAGYFRICLALCSQALLWKTFGDHSNDQEPQAFRGLLHAFPRTAFVLLWFIALTTLLSLSILYTLRCFYHFKMVKDEFLHHVGVNYLFAPWISWLFLLQSAPFLAPKTVYYLVLWLVFVVPIVVLDVKIYGQWFTKGKRFLSMVANPTSQLSVIGNLVGAQAAAEMGWKESALCMFSLGMAHYLVLFVTLYQRLSGSDRLPVVLHPVFFLFFAAPSMASLAWVSITGTFDTSSKMLFFLSLFLFASLVSRPNLFKKSMRRFNVAWWAYSFPLTVLALASTEYAREVKSSVSHGLMLVLSAISIAACLALLVFTALNTTNIFFVLPGNNNNNSSSRSSNLIINDDPPAVLITSPNNTSTINVSSASSCTTINYTIHPN
ncbi:Voltage-dependent anion channel [Macleaya cordata]|uniref:Voltage-dependent anion channel n=1 Tax=Macleaya cordata TaxID=56857 RepID=A0A200PYV5_MACCD|nr:Voltage-dependent anion channel [Macleaya cordata]